MEKLKNVPNHQPVCIYILLYSNPIFIVDLPIKNGWFKTMIFPLKTMDFPIKNDDFPIKNDVFPLKKRWISHEKRWFSHWKTMDFP